MAHVRNSQRLHNMRYCKWN